MTRWIIGTILVALLLAVACFGGGGLEGLESVIGDCQAGTTLRAGEGCTIANTDADDTFWIDQDGFACYSVQEGSFLSSSNSECSNASLSNDVMYARQNADGSWTVGRVP